MTDPAMTDPASRPVALGAQPTPPQPERTLGEIDLLARYRRPGIGVRQVRVGTVRYRQLTPSADIPEPPRDGTGFLSLRLRAELDLPARGWRPAAVFLRIRFDDPRVRASDLRTGSRSGPDRPTVSVSGSRTGTLGWFFSGLRPTGGAPPEFVVHALVEAPADLADLSVLTGTIRTEVPLVRPGPLRPRRCHARAAAPQEFALELPQRPPTAEGGPRTGPAAAPAPSASVRLCIAADIERYSRFRTPEAVRAQHRFVGVLARAREHAGIPEAQIDANSSGDGQFAVLPPGLDETVVIPGFVQGLAIALEEANADLSEHARLRLRIALHRGHVAWGVNGWVGDCAVAVHRLLDSAPAREGLVRNPAADFAFIVPDLLYRDVIAHGYGRLRPEAFSGVDVDIPAKSFAERAWVYVPGAG
jgi:hypothetical protein